MRGGNRWTDKRRRRRGARNLAALVVGQWLKSNDVLAGAHVNKARQSIRDARCNFDCGNGGFGIFVNSNQQHQR